MLVNHQLNARLTKCTVNLDKDIPALTYKLRSSTRNLRLGNRQKGKADDLISPKLILNIKETTDIKQ